MTFVSCNHISNLCLICHNGGWEKNNKSEHKILHCHVKKYCTDMWKNTALPCQEILHYHTKKYYMTITKYCKNCKCCPMSHFLEGLLWILRMMFSEMHIISVSKVTSFLDRSFKMSPHHSGKMSRRWQVSLVALWGCSLNVWGTAKNTALYKITECGYNALDINFGSWKR